MVESRDYTQTAKKWLVAIALLNLIGFNLAGILWLWFASHVGEYRKGFRIASIVFLSLAIIGSVVATLIAIRIGNSSGVWGIIWLQFRDPPLWLILLAAFVSIVVHGIPLIMLLSTGTRLAFERMNAENPSQICRACGYNLKAIESDTCPECGKRREVAKGTDDLL